jgi:addiction module HigA family antidote
MNDNKIPPIYPGEILQEECLVPLGISIEALAAEIGAPVERIRAIVQGTGDITAELALRLGRYFNISPQFWLNLQDHYELEIATDRLGDRLFSEVKVFAVAA